MNNRLSCFALLSLVMNVVPAVAQNPGIGDPAPLITVDQVLGTPESITPGDLAFDNLPNEVVLLEFWGTWCAPCVTAIPHLNHLYDELSDEITFLSVTFEAPEVIERFLEARPMKSWIGCDTDRSMVEAYNVSAWPTTFIIRDGVIAACTHPGSLQADRIRDWLQGEAASPVAAAEGHDAARDDMKIVGEDGRPQLGSYKPGHDPYSRLDETPLFQLIIREGGAARARGSSGSNATMIGATPKHLISMLWDIPIYAVQGEGWLMEARYDVIYRLPDGKRKAYLPLVQQLASTTLEFEVSFVEKPLDGFRLKAVEGGITLPDAISEHAGWSTRSDGQGNLTLTSSSMSLETLTEMLSSHLGAPVENATGSTDRYFIELTVNTADRNALRAVLRENGGLVLEPARIPVTVALVTRTADSEPDGSAGAE